MWMRYTFIILYLIEVKAYVDQKEYQKKSTEYYSKLLEKLRLLILPLLCQSLLHLESLLLLSTSPLGSGSDSSANSITHH